MPLKSRILLQVLLVLCLAPVGGAAADEAADEAAEGDGGDQERSADDDKLKDDGQRKRGLKSLKARYPGMEENEFEQYPMGLGIERQPLRLWMLPIVSYTTDLGAGYGLLATWKVAESERGPTHGIRVAGFYSALDASRLKIQWERTPGDAGIHLFADATGSEITYAPYFGVGNTVDPTPPTLPGLSAEQQAAVDPFYTRVNTQSGSLSLVAQKAITDDGKRVFGAARLRQYNLIAFDGARILEETGVDPGEGYETLLAETTPYGSTGGFAPMIQIGGMVDSRKINVAPASGAFHEFSVRGMSYVPNRGAERGTLMYGGVHLTLRRYVNLFGNWVLASRLVGDATFGDVPVFDLATFGAIDPYTGLGGTLAGRGLSLNHFVGKIKVLWGPELRYTPLSKTVEGGTLDLSFALFADSGRVWADWAPDGEGVGLHTGIGGGVRLIWAKRVLIRLDAAKAIQDDDPLGVYLVFGHPY